jgi:hypothetical protein
MRKENIFCTLKLAGKIICLSNASYNAIVQIFLLLEEKSSN